MKRLFLLCFLFSTNPLCLVSIHFDRHYYSEGSSSNRYWFFENVFKWHLPEESSVGARVLLARAPSPEYLVPRNKSDLQYTLEYNDNDELGSVSSPKPNFKKIIINRNVTFRKNKGEDASFYFGSNLKEEATKNLPEVKCFNLTGHLSNISFVDQFNSFKTIKQNNQGINNERLKLNASDIPQELRVIFQNRCKFLLLNSTIEETTTLKANLSEIYETLKNSDITKSIVKLLKEKLKRLNEQEKLRIQNTSDMYLITTQSPFSSSKWDIVREFFLKKDRPTSYVPNHTKKIKDVKVKESFSGRKNEKNIISKKLSETSGRIDTTQEFNNMVDNFYNDNVLKFVSKDNENTEYSDNYGNKIDDDTLEFFNINLPYNVEQNINTDNFEVNHDYATEKTDEENAGSKFVEETLTLKLPAKQNNKPSKSIESTRNTDHTTTTKYKKNRLVSVPTKNSKSEKLSDKLSNLFVWHKKYDGLKDKKTPILNERFLLTLNSKNQSKKKSSEIPEIHTIDNIPTLPEEYYSISYPLSFESASSESEDLYNNSIVFVMHKRNKTGLKKDAKWDSLLHFFHIAKGIPCPQGKNPCIDSPNGKCTFNNPNDNENAEIRYQMRTEAVTENSFETTTPKIIRLPKDLMPEALEGRQLNETDLMFYDDSSVRDEHNSTSSFLFFFK